MNGDILYKELLEEHKDRELWRNLLEEERKREEKLRQEMLINIQG